MNSLNISLDRHLSLRADHNHQKTAKNRIQPLHTITDFERYLIRENTYFRVLSGFDFKDKKSDSHK